MLTTVWVSPTPLCHRVYASICLVLCRTNLRPSIWSASYSKARSCVRGRAPATIYAILEREIRADVWARRG